MFDCKILSPGKRIKYIRKNLKMKQEDLTNGKYTRNLISYIENEKTKLRKETANVISQQLNKGLKEKGYNDILITPEFLLQSEKDQAKKCIDSLIEELYNNLIIEEKTDEDINSIEEMFKDIDEKIEKYPNNLQLAKLNDMKGDFFYCKEEIKKSSLFYLRSLEYYSKTEQTENYVDVILKQSRCKNRLNYFEEAIDLNDYALEILNKHNISNKNFMKRICFNTALSLKKIGKYDEALKKLNYIEDEFDLPFDKFIDIIILKGSIFNIMGKSILAKEHYNKAIKKINEHGDKTHQVKVLKLKALIGLSDILFKDKDIDGSINCKIAIIKESKELSLKKADELTLLISNLEKNKKVDENLLNEIYAIILEQSSLNFDDKIMLCGVLELVLIILIKDNDLKTTKDILDKLNLFIKKEREVIIKERIIDLLLVLAYNLSTTDPEFSKNILEIIIQTRGSSFVK